MSNAQAYVTLLFYFGIYLRFSLKVFQKQRNTIWSILIDMYSKASMKQSSLKVVTHVNTLIQNHQHLGAGLPAYHEGLASSCCRGWNKRLQVKASQGNLATTCLQMKEQELVV